MGFSHYWRQKSIPTTEQWNAIANDFNKLQAAALITTPFPIQRKCDDAAAPVVTNEYISFNGIGEDGHETMMLEKYGRDFNFCKTADKPYDRAVVALLILAHHHAPGVWEISSDGSKEDWQPVLDWMNTTGLGEFTLPFTKDTDD